MGKVCVAVFMSRHVSVVDLKSTALSLLAPTAAEPTVTATGHNLSQLQRPPPPAERVDPLGSRSILGAVSFSQRGPLGSAGSPGSLEAHCGFDSGLPTPHLQEPLPNRWWCVANPVSPAFLLLSGLILTIAGGAGAWPGKLSG